MNVNTEPVVAYKGQSLAELTEATILDEKEQTPFRKGTRTYNPMAETSLDESLTGNEKHCVESLLKRYRDMFAYPGNDRYSVDVEHTIPLTTNSPIACRPRRLPTKWKAEVEEEVRRLQRNGIIRPSTSGYAVSVQFERGMVVSAYMCRL